MKKIINGKAYDTEKAKELASYSNGGGWRDFRHFEETLYRKKTGEYFLHGEGGPMTQYAVADGISGWTGGERIMPLSYAEATTWAEEHLDGDEYESIFGEVVEDETRKAVTYTLSVSTIERIRRMADQSGKSASEILDELVLGKEERK